MLNLCVERHNHTAATFQPFERGVILLFELSNTLLKNYSQSTAVYVTKKHARSRRSAEPYIQLLVAGGTGA
ncbi:MAG: hypothetical protein ABSD64_12885, partial [Terriglobales bacterium]